MLPLNYDQIIKKMRWENLIILLSILFISSASNIIAINYITLIFVFLYVLMLFIKRGLSLQPTIFLLVIIYLISLAIYYITFGWLDILFSIRMILIFILGYLAIRLLQESFFTLFETVIYISAIVSLLFFSLQLIFYKELYNIFKLFQHIIPSASDDYVSIIFFSINKNAQTRNSGFAWEPKGFGNFLIIAIVINLVQNRFRINKKLLVFIAATLTTFSTVAYINLFVLIPIFYIINMNKKYFLLFVPVFLIIIIFAFQLPFMQNKMEREWNNRFEYKKSLSASHSSGAVSLGRMPGMMVDIKDFLKHPILGYGMQRSERTQSLYTHLVRVNGLSDWLASFGIVGFTFLILSHYFGLRKYLINNQMHGQIILVLVILVIYFGTNVKIHSFWIMLQFLFVINYLREKKIHQREKISSLHIVT